MLNMDTSHRPVRISDWSAVLEAVFAADPSDEQDWLEWKSTLDLRSKEQMATVVAKAIIAMANRDPDRAARAVGGIGILLIGIEPGNVTGVEAVDNADLDNLISPYVGADGPVWLPHWTQYRGKKILIIEIGPPQWGDPIHTFRKEIQVQSSVQGKEPRTISNGAIFVRKLAKSAPAGHVEVTRLGDRRATRAPEGLDLAVDIETTSPLSRYGWDSSQLDQFLGFKRDELMAPIIEEQQQSSRARPSTGLFATFADESSSYGLGPTRMREKRSPAEYQSAVNAYLEDVRAAWPDIMRTAAANFVLPPRFVLANRSTRNYEKVLVELYVAGEADAAEFEPATEGLNLDELLPHPPRRWGPWNLPMSSMLDSIHSYGTLSNVRSATAHPPSVTIERGGGFRLRFAPVDLRPEQIHVLTKHVSVLIPATRTAPVTATWKATATNTDGPPATGSFTIAFGGPDLNVLAEVLRAGRKGT
ncbi:putative DNA binding domain-containing protein [Actinoplanes sp. NEAU-A12]|uniref:DNA binding domain-containing protein n=1 Tax=Actinoplanes sandaracinus TaxID=3045177 RepID=A0ABT6WZL9_9ACTN|nr:RNA-binding domain-containing protein [Actinoplanes sandaracinus]MDI6105035.1 putative DNA binding domain-containing protein [Actinoplanes sandaracinus]